MTRILLIAISSVVAIIVDLYIYRRIISRHGFSKWWKTGYLVYALIVDTAILSALLIYHTASDGDNPYMLKAVMWTIFFFFLNAGPKSVYALVSLGDYAVQRRRGRISHCFGYAGTFLGLCLAAAMLFGMTAGRNRIRLSVVELECAKLPPSFDGLRVVQFADIHLGTLINRDAFLNRLVDDINTLKPDIVVNSGDMVNTHYRELDENAIRILEGMDARYGVYGTLGNHDMGIYIKDTVALPREVNARELSARLRRMGWKLLEDETVYLVDGPDSITLSGFDFPMSYAGNGHARELHGTDTAGAYGNIPESLFNIAMIHAPQQWNDLLSADRADLTLAGHVHAMQMKVRIGQFAWSPARFFYDRWSGLYEEQGRFLYVNDGIGYVMFPMRMGAKPEITLFILRSGDENRILKYDKN